MLSAQLIRTLSSSLLRNKPSLRHRLRLFSSSSIISPLSSLTMEDTNPEPDSKSKSKPSGPSHLVDESYLKAVTQKRISFFEFVKAQQIEERNRIGGELIAAVEIGQLRRGAAMGGVFGRKILCFLGSMEVSVWTLSVDQKNNAKGDTSNSGDRISQLPEHILSCILSILTMRDASKAKMLSPSWRHLSASTLNLHFDQSSLFGINDNKISISDTDGKLRFVKAVDQYLQQWRGPKIYSFKVCYTLGKEFAYHIDRWISSAISGQTEKLELIFSLYSIPSFGDQLYDFPCHLHSQAEAFRLKHLLLTYCSMSRAAFHSIFSGCINLKSFELRRCMLPVCVFICSPLHLESLIFENCEGADKIELSIDVTTFEYTGKMTDLRFVGAPFVEKVHLKILNPFERGTNYMFNGLAKELPQLQILSLSCFTKELDPVPANMARFSHLKELELLVYLYPHFDLLSVALILNATPCLQKFHLALNHSENRRKLQKCVFGKQFYYKLKKVEISGFRDRCNALDLAVYLLNSAVRLEQMIIDIGKSWKLGFNGWYYEKKHSSYENDQKHVHDVLSKENPNVKISVL